MSDAKEKGNEKESRRYDYALCLDRLCEAGKEGRPTLMPYRDVVCVVEVLTVVPGDRVLKAGYDRWCFGVVDMKGQKAVRTVVDVLVVGGELVDVLYAGKGSRTSVLEVLFGQGMMDENQRQKVRRMWRSRKGRHAVLLTFTKFFFVLMTAVLREGGDLGEVCDWSDVPGELKSVWDGK